MFLYETNKRIYAASVKKKLKGCEAKKGHKLLLNEDSVDVILHEDTNNI